MTSTALALTAWAIVSLGQAPTEPAPVRRVASAPHVTVDLIADPAPSADGGFWVGIRFRLDEHWHLYWQNPGDSGAAPTAAWRTPDHLSVGPFVWPAPERIDVGGLINYGYHGSVVLPARAHLSPGATTRGRLGVALRWLVCHDLCVPGRADLSLDLDNPGVVPNESGAWGDALAHARSRVPVPAPADWVVSAAERPETFDLTIRTGHRTASAVFFPVQPSMIDDAAPQIAVPTDEGLRLTLRKSAQLAGIPERLPGVLQLSGWPPFAVDIPLVR